MILSRDYPPNFLYYLAASQIFPGVPAYTDQTGFTIQLDAVPKRIVSIVPSQTELLADLGLQDEACGITKFCVHPQNWFKTKKRVGGTKQLDLDAIRSLQPDLVLANKEENLRDQVETLRNEFPVWTSDIQNLDDALAMIRQTGLLTGKPAKAAEIISGIQSGFAALTPSAGNTPAIYLIWRKPYMSAGGDTFIHAIMEKAGLNNLFAGRQRYPETSIDELVQLKPALLLLSSEPFPFSQKHADELQPLLPGTRIMLVDGEMFSWYGSRLLFVPGYLKKLFSPASGIR